MTLVSSATVVAITGAGGFLGRHLVDHLRGHDGLVLRLLYRPGGTTDGPLEAGDVVRGDLRAPETSLSLVRPQSVVVNLAHLASGSRHENLRMAENLADACDRVGAARLVHCSSAGVTGNVRAGVVTEATPCEPVTEYQRTKLLIERVLLSRLEGRCPVTIVRPTAVFGPESRDLARWANDLIQRTRAYTWLETTILANRRLHLVGVDNVVAALSFLLSRTGPATPECFIVSEDDADANNCRDVMRILARELGLPSIPGFPPGVPSTLLNIALRLTGRADTNARRVYSCRKLLELGFRRPMSLEQGLRRFARAYVESAGRSTIGPDGSMMPGGPAKKPNTVEWHE